MLDGITISKNFEGKDTPNLSILQDPFQNERGDIFGNIEGCKRMGLEWKESERLLKIRGSMPYYWQGHNFIFSKDSFVDAVEYLQNRLGVGIWDASLDFVEMGVIFEVERRPMEYIINHHAKPKTRFLENEIAKSRGTFKYWEPRGGGDSLKMYDAGRNIKTKQDLGRREAIRRAGWEPDRNYLKIEAKIRHPERVNGGKSLLLEDCINPTKYELLRERLRELYNQIEAMRTFETPTDKKHLSTQDLLTRFFVEEYINNHDSSPEDAKRVAYERINAVDDNVLTAEDKKARKRQINALFGKLILSDASTYELTDKMEAALAAEPW